MIVIETLVDVPITRKKKEKLPRGIRRRGSSLYAVLTHPDGRQERRCVGNVHKTVQIEQQRARGPRGNRCRDVTVVL